MRRGRSRWLRRVGVEVVVLEKGRVVVTVTVDGEAGRVGGRGGCGG
jgi:hypothetical protein